MPAKYSYKEMVDSFYRNAYPEPNTGCWIWGASCINDGYGAIRFNIGGIIFYLAHRFSYHHHNGPFDQNLCVCHSCDNGVLNPNSKVTIDDVMVIRNSPLATVQLSGIYGISLSQVMNIKNLKSWKNV